MSQMPPDTPLVLTVDVPEADWQALCQQIETENNDGFRAYVRFLHAARFIGASDTDLRVAFRDEEIALILAADDQTFSHPDRPLRCIEPEGRAPSFRAALRHLWIVENNVSIGNTLFEEIAGDQVIGGWLRPDGF